MPAPAECVHCPCPASAHKAPTKPYGHRPCAGCSCPFFEAAFEGASATEAAAEMVEHPAHYGGKDNPYEVIKVLKAWGLIRDAYRWNVVKYVARAGKKGDELEDLKKARFYLNEAIKEREEA